MMANIRETSSEPITEGFVPVRESKTCKRCHSEIVETINDSNFNEGECGPCEYERYQLQPEFADLLNLLLSETLDNDLDAGNELTDREQDIRETALALFAKADGLQT